MEYINQSEAVVSKRSKEYINVAFTGKFASGKTYFANLLNSMLKERGIISYRVSIAKKIKDIATDLFDVKDKDRSLLQGIGAKMREINPNVWINYLVVDIKRGNKVPFIVDDVRFTNEVDTIKKSFPILIVVKIITDENKRIDIYKKLYGREPTKEEINDSTETNIDNIKYDYLIINDYRSETAKKEIERLIKTYLK